MSFNIVYVTCKRCGKATGTPYKIALALPETKFYCSTTCKLWDKPSEVLF